MTEQLTIRLTKDQEEHAQRDKDFTFVWRKDRFLDETALPKDHAAVLTFQRPLNLDKPDSFRFDEVVNLELGSGEIVSARANIVRCNRGKWISGTFRVESDYERSGGQDVAPSELIYEENRSEPSNKTHASVLKDLIFGLSPRIAGAIVFCGPTKSCKSSLARALVSNIFSNIEIQKYCRYPHLVTIEDPIESWLTFGGKGSPLDLLEDPSSAERKGICLTAREVGKDLPNVCEGLKDALRQTPTCVFIGEVRNMDTWPAILNFAGTGHLVIATCHAASVRECLAKIIAACEAKTPAERRQWANCLQGIVHSNLSNNCLTLSLWKRSGAAINSLVSVGLSSVAPNRTYHFGRQHYFCELLKKSAFHEMEAYLANCKTIDLQELMNQ